MTKIKTVLLGLGTVNIGLLKILNAKHDYLIRKHDMEFSIIAVADSSGIAVNQNGFNYDQLINLKNAKGKVSSLQGFIQNAPSEDIAHHTDAQLLIESSPVNLTTGNPGLTAAKLALTKGMHVVFANKAPLVFAFDELHKIASLHNCRVTYSATVCGGLPVINILQRDMIATSLIKFSGILNATTNHILDVLESGGSMADGIKEAQRLGAAEADPSHDTSGHDTANKLFIIMKSFTNYSGTIHDIEVKGIDQITSTQLSEVRKKGNTIKLVASAEPHNNAWKLSVKPTEIRANSFLGTCKGWEMGIEFETDLYETISMKIYEEDPMATSAAVLRDALNICLRS